MIRRKVTLEWDDDGGEDNVHKVVVAMKRVAYSITAKDIVIVVDDTETHHPTPEPPGWKKETTDG